MKYTCLLFFLILLVSFRSFSQTADSLSAKTDSVISQDNIINHDEHIRITAKDYFILLGSDFKQQVTKPFHMSGKDWLRLGIFAATTGALTMADEPIQKFAIKLSDDSKTLRDVSGFVTKFGGTYEVCMLGALGAYGFIFKDEKMRTTTLLATQSYITSSVHAFIIKFLAGRQRPIDDDPRFGEAEPTFYGPFYNSGKNKDEKKNNRSFPSGHTTSAFSAATVYAMEYRDKPWVPFVSYGAATLVGLSRLTENKHWFTDVLVGATLGYLTGRQVVNNYHRYSKAKSSGQKKNTVTFNLQYNNGVIMPGLVYQFR